MKGYGGGVARRLTAPHGPGYAAWTRTFPWNVFHLQVTYPSVLGRSVLAVTVRRQLLAPPAWDRVPCRGALASPSARN